MNPNLPMSQQDNEFPLIEDWIDSHCIECGKRCNMVTAEIIDDEDGKHLICGGCSVSVMQDEPLWVISIDLGADHNNTMRVTDPYDNILGLVAGNPKLLSAEYAE